MDVDTNIFCTFFASLCAYMLRYNRPIPREVQLYAWEIEEAFSKIMSGRRRNVGG